MTGERRDLELFNDCFARNDQRRPLEALEWLYLHNPTKQMFVDVAQPSDDERIAAIYASLPVRIRINGEVHLALQSLDTLTDSDFRGKGLFVTLAKRVFARAEAKGAALIYGFPNKNSAPGFFRKLGWTNLDPVPFLIRPLRLRYLLNRVRPGMAFVPDLPIPFPRAPVPRGVTLEEFTAFDSAFDDLWHAFARDVRVGVERNATYLSWRLVDKPGPRYRRVGAYRNGRLVAFAAFHTMDKHGGRCGYLMELLHLPGERAAGVGLAAHAVAEMAREHADFVLACCFGHSPNFLTYVGAGFAPFPERFRPIELHLGVRTFDDRFAVARDRSSWYLSYLDADTA